MNIPKLKLSCEHFGIKANRLLLPIDLTKCPLEIFQLANGLTKPFDGEIVLLYVLDQGKLAPQRELAEIEIRRAKRHLERLGHHYLSPKLQASFRVRTGVPHEEILAEATETNVELILFPTFRPSIWRQLVGFIYRETVRNLVAAAPCRVFVIDVQTRTNCFRRWAKEESLSQCTI
jgi:nucleotide-binding universal stress UspA family protein